MRCNVMRRDGYGMGIGYGGVYWQWDGMFVGWRLIRVELDGIGLVGLASGVGGGSIEPPKSGGGGGKRAQLEGTFNQLLLTPAPKARKNHLEEGC